MKISKKAARQKNAPLGLQPFPTGTAAQMNICADYTVRLDNGALAVLAYENFRQVYLRGDSFRSNRARLSAAGRALCAA